MPLDNESETDYVSESDINPRLHSNLNYHPVTGTVVPRFAGIATLMRLPHIDITDIDHFDVDIGLIGVPSDIGTTNRSGARFGPRAVRDASTMVRNINRASNINPFTLCNCCDLGDAPVNPCDNAVNMEVITRYFNKVYDSKIIPLSVGGDHLISLPILRAIAKSAPVALIHFDAHCDMYDSYFHGQSRYTHGTVFRRAIEENLINPKHIIQIGIRGALYDDVIDTFAEDHKIRIIDIDEFYDKGIQRTLEIIREVVPMDMPVYVSFDIDVLDPIYAPGTGTPEIGGMTSYEAQRLIRGLEGFNIIGADIVEIAPQYDNTTNTALTAATLMFELLCVMAKNIHKSKSRPSSF